MIRYTAEQAFKAAIDGAFLSDDPDHGEDFAGNWMYMGPGLSHPDEVVFKHIVSRETFTFVIDPDQL